MGGRTKFCAFSGNFLCGGPAQVAGGSTQRRLHGALWWSSSEERQSQRSPPVTVALFMCCAQWRGGRQGQGCRIPDATSTHSQQTWSWGGEFLVVPTSSNMSLWIWL